MRTSDNFAVEARSLTCGYPESVVLRDLCFAVESGEVVALIGPNGSGKSTLLNTLGGVIPALGGEIEFLGASASGLPTDRRARMVATVPQEEAPAFEFTAREMVLMARIPHSHGLFETPEDQAAAEAALVVVQALDLADRPFTKLSGGERQRILIARALAQESPILLLDEPSAHLDLHYQKEFVGMVRTLSREHGKTVIAAVHDLNLAMAISERVLLLAENQLQYDGPPGSLLESGRLESVFGVEITSFRISEQQLGCLPRY